MLENKDIALVTGAGGGIGAAIALELSKQNMHVIITGKTLSSLSETENNINSNKGSCTIVQLDMRDLSGIDKLGIEIFNRWGKLDCLVSNAAILGTMTSLEDYDLSTWDEVMNINLRAPFLLSKSLKIMLEDASLPRLIFTSSGVANIGKAYWGAYSVSKFGVKGLAEILADELEATSSIRVFNFDPGATRTNMRASARPAENPNTVKSADELLNCYLWFFKEESSRAEKNYFEFSELSKIVNST
mgnify:CR=1 FL=1